MDLYPRNGICCQEGDPVRNRRLAFNKIFREGILKEIKSSGK